MKFQIWVEESVVIEEPLIIGENAHDWVELLKQ